MLEKHQRLTTVCERHGIDLRTAVPPIFAAIVPDAQSAAQAEANITSMKVAIPALLWEKLRSEGLVAGDATVLP